MDFFNPVLFTFLSSLICIGFCKPIANRIGLLDRPNGRKAHDGAIPLVGGISIFISILFASLFFMPKSEALNIYLVASALIVGIGVVDDYIDLPVKPRVLAQILIAVMMIFGADLYIQNLGNIFGFGDVELGFIGIVFTVLAVIGAINAFNMVDGIDGLAGSLAIITFGSLAFLMSNTTDGWFLLSILFIVATAAYLMFNLEWPISKLKKIFMGDAGSMLIGLTIIWLLIIGTQSPNKSFSPVVALRLIAIPLMDMAAIMMRRIRKGQSPFKPDREHLHHIFLRAGFSQRKTLFIICSIATLMALLGVFLERINIPEWFSLMLFIICFIGYSYALKHIWKLLTLFRRIESKKFD